ncbi:hypothetical protein BJV74DRAFT_421498 [Russula compacta]|nr:hypothetical protein BJV74DRAFT_421498 [Russula compacta]
MTDSTEHYGGDPEGPSKLTIDDIPDEVLLEIFDSYRQFFIKARPNVWNRRLKWFKLIHVCKRWRRIVFASSTRLNLHLVVTTNNPGHMKTIFSPHIPSLPIAVDYRLRKLFAHYPRSNAKDLRRVLAALKRRDRVRRIAFSGTGPDFDNFFKATKHPFPALSSLDLRNQFTRKPELKLPATFLKGSAPHLRYLTLHFFSFASMSQLLSSATALIELHLGINISYGLLPTASLLAHLQSMRSLRRLELRTEGVPSSINGPMPPTKSGDIVRLSKLTCFRYQGHSLFLDALVAGFAAPYLLDVHIVLGDNTEFLILHFTRFIDNVEKLCHSAQVIFERDYFRISLLTDSEPVDCVTPPFRFCSARFPGSMMQMSAALSGKLATVEELLIVFTTRSYPAWHDAIPWRSFLQQFRSVKILRVEHTDIVDITHTLLPDDDESTVDFLPMLEEIEIRTYCAESPPVSEQAATASHRFIVARQEAGRPVKVSASLRAVFPPESRLRVFSN